MGRRLGSLRVDESINTWMRAYERKTRIMVAGNVVGNDRIIDTLGKISFKIVWR